MTVLELIFGKALPPASPPVSLVQPKGSPKEPNAAPTASPALALHAAEGKRGREAALLSGSNGQRLPCDGVAAPCTRVTQAWQFPESRRAMVGGALGPVVCCSELTDLCPGHANGLETTVSAVPGRETLLSPGLVAVHDPGGRPGEDRSVSLHVPLSSAPGGTRSEGTDNPVAGGTGEGRKAGRGWGWGEKGACPAQQGPRGRAKARGCTSRDAGAWNSLDWSGACVRARVGEGSAAGAENGPWRGCHAKPESWVFIL